MSVSFQAQADFDALVKLLGDMGIPDRYGFIGGIRAHVADMLVHAVKDKGPDAVQTAMNGAVVLAARIAQTPAPVPPAPDPSR